MESRDRPPNRGDLPETAEPVDKPDDSGKGTVVEKVKFSDDSCNCVSGNSQSMHGPYLYRYYREDETMKLKYAGKS